MPHTLCVLFAPLSYVRQGRSDLLDRQFLNQTPECGLYYEPFRVISQTDSCTFNILLSQIVELTLKM